MLILINLFGYLLFPSLLGLTLLALYFGPYRTIKDVNQPLEDYRRPRSLQRLMQVLLGMRAQYFPDRTILPASILSSCPHDVDRF